LPEGVEVKISAELIKPLVVGKQVRRVRFGESSRYAAKLPKGFIEFENSFYTVTEAINIIEKCTITDVQTKGKFMYWTFDNGWYLFSTFGMTGQWGPEPGDHVCLEMSLIDYSQPFTQKALSRVYFNDPRHFGTIQFVKGKDALQKKLGELGWDPLFDGMDENWIKYIVKTCGKKDKPIGQLLMDQGIFSGVGNYIRAEALYLAKMSPWRVANTLTKEEVKQLCQAIVIIMNESYQHQGATILTYKDAYGAEGKYSSCFKVYGQTLDPLGNKIVKEETPEGRTIHWCPTVQV